MKIALANVKYSPNLGDGLIAECLEWALGQCLPGAQFSAVDLAGRTGFDPGGGAGRGRALALLAALPQPLRQMAISAILRTLIETRYKKTWASRLEGCDRVLLGGGQLMADADLNFPLKIGALSALCRERGLQTAVFGVGVSKDWSGAGTRLFRAAMEDFKPSHVAVRDEASARNWSRHFAGASLPPAQLCRDPGLLAGLVYPAPPRPSRLRPLVGVGVVHPLTLNLHSHGAPLTLSEGMTFWTSIANALIAAGLDVALFTNGPTDDEAFAALILQEMTAAAPGRILRIPRPQLPSDLVSNIAGCDAILAHRLHANIIAFAQKVPHVGLGWDAKLPAFFASVGRGGFIADEPRSVPPGRIAQMVVEAIRNPVPDSVHEAVIAETWTGIRNCANALQPGRSS